MLKMDYKFLHEKKTSFMGMKLPQPNWNFQTHKKKFKKKVGLTLNICTPKKKIFKCQIWMKNT